MVNETKKDNSCGIGGAKNRIRWIIIMVVLCSAFIIGGVALAYFTSSATKSGELDFADFNLNVKKNVNEVLTDVSSITYNKKFIPGDSLDFTNLAITNSGDTDCYALLKLKVTISVNQTVAPEAPNITYSTWYNLDGQLVHTYQIENNKTSSTLLTAGQTKYLDLDYVLSAKDITSDYMKGKLNIDFTVCGIQTYIPEFMTYTSSEKLLKSARYIIEKLGGTDETRTYKLKVDLGNYTEQHTLVAGSSIENAMKAVGIDDRYPEETYGKIYSDRARTYELDEQDTLWSDMTVYAGTTQTLPVTATVTTTAGITTASISSASEIRGAYIVPTQVYDSTSEAMVSVTSIGTNAFKNNSTITSVVIPETVTSIGNGAFQGCSQLTEVIIPPTCTSIGRYAFSASGVEDIDWENMLYDEIEYGLFYNCTLLTSVTIPASVKSIGPGAFQACVRLRNVIFDKNSELETIDFCAFMGCNKLTSISLPQSLTTIGESAFNSCVVLASVNFASNSDLTQVSSNAFLNCKKLTSIDFSDTKLATIGGYAFSGSGLVSITFSSMLTTIGSMAFASCGLTSITIPNNVTTLSANTFKDCTSLSTVNIGTGLTSINAQAFNGCTELSSVTFADTTYKWRANNVSFSVATPSTNAENLKTTYVNYSWVKTSTLDA